MIYFNAESQNTSATKQAEIDDFTVKIEGMSYQLPLSGKFSKSGQRRLRTETQTTHLYLAANYQTEANSPPTPNRSDLEEIVGLPFVHGQESFCIHDQNSKGETVGRATFKKDHDFENLAWYWNSENGFQIISSKTELIDAYHKDQQHQFFEFHKLAINESGVVAGSFLIEQVNDRRGHYNQCPWFWWSPEKGLTLNPCPTSYEYLVDVNNSGQVLFNCPKKGYIIRDINDSEFCHRVEYPTTLVNEDIKSWLIKYLQRPGADARIAQIVQNAKPDRLWVRYFDQIEELSPTLNVDRFLENENIHGRCGSRCTLIYGNPMGGPQNLIPQSIIISIEFIIDGANATVNIKEVFNKIN